MNTEKPLSAYIAAIPWFIRPNCTDWSYHQDVTHVSEFVPNLRVNQQRSLRVTAVENAKYVGRRLLARAGLLDRRHLGNVVFQLDRGELLRSKSDVVWTHWGLPTNATGYPVIWNHAIVDPEMRRSFGLSADIIEHEIAVKRPLFRKCSVLHVMTQIEAARHEATMPELKGRVHAVPFFLPYLRPLEAEAVRSKHLASDEIRILFVGRNAYRKGLDLVLEAFQKLADARASRLKLTIVSSMSDRAYPIPSRADVIWMSAATRQEVQHLMREAHIFAMPSREESYGIVFVEALAAGAIPIAPNWEVQRELLDEGLCGKLVRPAAVSVANAIEELVGQSAATRAEIALRGLDRFGKLYSPAVVAQQMKSMFAAAVSLR